MKGSDRTNRRQGRRTLSSGPGWLAVCLALAACSPPPRDGTPPARYQLAVDGTGNAWRLDTVTGETRRCWQGTPGVRSPSCYVATMEGP